MAGKQIEFHENQRHPRNFELALWGICVVCIVFVLIAISSVGGGGL